jgi:hypothetical protein
MANQAKNDRSSDRRKCVNPPSSGAEAQAQIAELNLLFLTLLEALERSPQECSGTGVCGLEPAELARLLRLDPGRRNALCSAPVALFHLPLTEPGVGDGQDPLPWTPPGTASLLQAFALTALAGAWHIARTQPAWAGLGFGYGSAEIALLQRAPLARLPALASPAAHRVVARFAHHNRFWPVALALAAGCKESELRLAAASAFLLASAERVARERIPNAAAFRLTLETIPGAQPVRC